jgi:hypothetical protein
MRSSRFKLIGITILVLIGLCSIIYAARHVPAQLALRNNQLLWERQHPAHYRYTFTLSCLCPYHSVQIDVKNDTVTTITRISDGSPEPIARYKDFAPLEQLFQLIDQEFRNGVLWAAVSYDPVYGYPQQIDIRVRGYGSEDTAAFTVTDFSVMK